MINNKCMSSKTLFKVFWKKYIYIYHVELETGIQKSMHSLPVNSQIFSL